MPEWEDYLEGRLKDEEFRVEWEKIERRSRIGNFLYWLLVVAIVGAIVISVLTWVIGNAVICQIAGC